MHYIGLLNIYLYLHSNMELLLHKVAHHSYCTPEIYIPIWSYFYLAIESVCCCAALFTFQYGATSTEKISTIVDPVNKFTFQYGATSTLAEKLGISPSAIFTFQYGATSTLYVNSGIKLFSEFTFQYEATSTQSALHIQTLYLHLHSNMELLLPKDK